MPKGFRKDGTKLGFQKGNIPWNINIPCAEEVKIKLSKAHKKLGTKPPTGFGEDSSFFGHHHTEKSKKMIGKKNTKNGIKKFKSHNKTYLALLTHNHPNAIGQNKNYILLHRYVAEGILGRFLKRVEQVHHIDGDTENNLPENLYLFRHNSAHSRFEAFCRRHNLIKANLLTSNLQFYAN